jgi:hypothetical protein
MEFARGSLYDERKNHNMLWLLNVDLSRITANDNAKVGGE